MVGEGNEYMGSLNNYLDRKNRDKKETENVLVADPEYLKRVEIADKVIETLDRGYETTRDSIFDAIANGEYKNGVLAFGPTMVNTTPERRADVERLAAKAGKLYQLLLVEIEDYGTGKRDTIPEFEIGGEDIPDSKTRQSKLDDPDINYIQ